MKEIIRVLEQDELIGAAQPMILGPRAKGSFSGLNYIDQYGYVIPTDHGIRKALVNKEYYEIAFPLACCSVVRRSILSKLGYLYNEDFEVYYDDVDFGLRLWIMGYKVAYVPKVHIYHHEGGTSTKVIKPKKALYLDARNRIYSLLSICDTVHILKTLPFSILTSTALLILSGDKDSFKILKFLKRIVMTRKIIQKRKKVTFRDLIGRVVLIPKPNFPRPLYTFLYLIFKTPKYSFYASKEFEIIIPNPWQSE